MAKYLKKEKKKPGKIILVVVLLLIAAALAAVCVLYPQLPGIPDNGEASAPEQTQPVTENVTDPTAGQEPLPVLEYPLILEDGRLEITNLFQYEGINPDCGLEEGREVASVTLKNTSGDYLEEARIALTLTDGTVLSFTVMDLPAGKTVMAFETANTAAEENAACTGVSCAASWAEGITALPEGIGLAVDGVNITVTNNTGHDISELVISCRCPLDEAYFGGIAYRYTMNDLPANGSATVEARDCILGIAEVVRAAENQE